MLLVISGNDDLLDGTFGERVVIDAAWQPASKLAVGFFMSLFCYDA